MEIDRCTHQDFLGILTDLEDFWGSDRARAVHHPMFVHEFGDTAWVVREDGRVVGYLFGFWSQTEPIGYIHLVGVRRSHQRLGIGRSLYERFEALARERAAQDSRPSRLPSTPTQSSFTGASASRSLVSQTRMASLSSTTTSDLGCRGLCSRSGSTEVGLYAEPELPRA